MIIIFSFEPSLYGWTRLNSESPRRSLEKGNVVVVVVDVWFLSCQASRFAASRSSTKSSSSSSLCHIKQRAFKSKGVWLLIVSVCYFYGGLFSYVSAFILELISFFSLAFFSLVSPLLWFSSASSMLICQLNAMECNSLRLVIVLYIVV